MKISTIQYHKCPKTENETVVIQTNKGNINLRKFGKDFISLQDVPYNFKKESSLYLDIKRCLIVGNDLSQFIGCSF